MISIIILTKNEEEDLPRCLSSLRHFDDVHVVDSGSSDETVRIARTFGARIYENPFISFGEQRNWSLDHCDIKHPWVLFLDADEAANVEFVAALDKAVGNASDSIAGFYCCWKQIYDGRWLKRCDSFPKWQFRLLRKGLARFTDFGHGQKEFVLAGSVAYIPIPYEHYGLSKGIGFWLERHNRYATLEAAARLSAKIEWRNVFSAHGSKRNQALKPIVSRLPGWPLIRFFITYVLRLGFLEGRPGFVYCASLAFYEFLIRIKMREARLSARARTNSDLFSASESECNSIRAKSGV
ncbi:MAG: glycosyltransferase family 2 protein [Limisphaerales bacterium]